LRGYRGFVGRRDFGRSPSRSQRTRVFMGISGRKGRNAAELGACRSSDRRRASRNCGAELWARRVAHRSERRLLAMGPQPTASGRGHRRCGSSPQGRCFLALNLNHVLQQQSPEWRPWRRATRMRLPTAFSREQVRRRSNLMTLRKFYRSSIKPSKKAPSSAWASSGRTLATYWSGRTITRHPLFRAMPLRSKTSLRLFKSGQNIFS
jgi:hypothetical protein